jgi:hypothetical protein
MPEKYQPEGLDVIPVASHPTKTSKIMNKVAVVALVIIAIGIGLFLKWSYQSENVLQVKNEPFPVRTIRNHPTAGGVVILTVDYCKLQEAKGDLRISFVSPSREVFLPLAEEDGPVGCFKTEFPVLIPRDIPADEYRIKFRVLNYKLNPLKTAVDDSFQSQSVIIDPTTPTNSR